MLFHSLKLAISGRAEKEILETDQRLRQADIKLTELQRWFPKLQAAVEENEKHWASLGYNLCHISKVAREVYAEEHEMQFALLSLFEAGETILKPNGAEIMKRERCRSAAELCAFNDNVRQLRALQKECLISLRNKHYYSVKVESMSKQENRKLKMSEKENGRRLRNEEKLNNYTMQVNFKVEKLKTEMEKVLSKKEHVLNMVTSSYINTQHLYFSKAPITPVMHLLERVIASKGTGQIGSFATSGSSKNSQDMPSDGMNPQLPRSPSLPLRKLSNKKPSMGRLTVACHTRIPVRDLSNRDEFGRKSMDKIRPEYEKSLQFEEQSSIASKVQESMEFKTTRSD